MGTSKSGLYLNTKGSSRRVSDFALVHSNEGTFMNVKSLNPKKSPFRMASGGHGEDNIKLLNKYGIKYNIVKTYPNGVRVGSIEENVKIMGKHGFLNHGQRKIFKEQESMLRL